MQRRQDLRDLLADVAALPDEQRAALVLAELGACSHEEIATVLAVPRDKVKALVFQGRSSLIASRTARETPCAEIREQLAILRGGSLRRTTLRRHLRECPGCRAFRSELAPSTARSRPRSRSSRRPGSSTPRSWPASAPASTTGWAGPGALGSSADVRAATDAQGRRARRP